MFDFHWSSSSIIDCSCFLNFRRFPVITLAHWRFRLMFSALLFIADLLLFGSKSTASLFSPSFLNFDEIYFNEIINTIGYLIFHAFIFHRKIFFTCDFSVHYNCIRCVIKRKCWNPLPKVYTSLLTYETCQSIEKTGILC